jgi:hypothetical protein
MHLQPNKVASFVKIGLCTILALAFVSLAQAQEKKLDGTWGWTMPGRNGGPDRKITLKLQTEGEKVTGTILSPGRDGATNETKIEDGKFKDGELSFSVTREMNGNKLTSKYKGKLDADTIKGKVEFTRNGEAQSRDWEAKRAAAGAK